MKKLSIITAFTILALNLNAQTYKIDEETNLMTYSKVCNIENKNSEEVFSLVKISLSKMYNDYKNVQQVEDKENKTIVIKAYFDTYVQVGFSKENYGGCSYILTIQCKDNKCRITIDNIVHNCNYYTKDCSAGGAIENEKPNGNWASKMPNKRWVQIRDFSKYYCEKLGYDIEENFNKNKKRNNQNW
jgi:hypothetical protein